MAKSTTSSSTSSGERQVRTKKVVIIKNLIFAAILLAIYFLEGTYRTAMFSKSIEWQISLQDRITPAGIDIFRAFSLWGDGAPYFLAFAFMFNWESQARSFYYLLFLTACGFLMNLTKMAYHEPRPFMVTD